MPKLLDKPLTRICTRVYTEDLEELDKLAAASGEPRDKLLRTILHTYIQRAGDKVRKRIDALDKV